MKFSIVTPVFNGEKFLEDSIKSVLSQKGDFEIEYIIIDGKSADNTLEIIKKYDNLIKTDQFPIKCLGIKLKWISEKDKGMYDAVNKGFMMATGDIYAYINSDDFYLPDAFNIISKTFVIFPNIRWLKGITNFLDQKTKEITLGACLIYNRGWITMGIYGRNAYFIHQDSVFWKSDLWNELGPINSTLKYAGDYDLWIKFSKSEPLWSLNKSVSCFRKREGQLSADMSEYRQEQQQISQEKGFLNFKIKIFFWLKQKFIYKIFDDFFIILYKFLFADRNKEYININNSGELVIKQSKTYKIDEK